MLLKTCILNTKVMDQSEPEQSIWQSAFGGECQFDELK